MFAAGARGITELRQNVSEDNVYFAFIRESVDDARFYATIAYIPEGVSGLRRSTFAALIVLHAADISFVRPVARALATARTVQSWFKVCNRHVPHLVHRYS